MTATTTESAPTGHPEPILFHWIMTVRTDDGCQATNDGRISATPGAHTHETTYQAVRKAMEGVVGTDHFTVIFFNLAPNQI